MAVLKQTSPTASPTAPTPSPCSTVPSASTSTPVTPGSRSRLMVGGSFWANGGVGSESRNAGQCDGDGYALHRPRPRGLGGLQGAAARPADPHAEPDPAEAAGRLPARPPGPRQGADRRGGLPRLRPRDRPGVREAGRTPGLV